MFTLAYADESRIASRMGFIADFLRRSDSVGSPRTGHDSGNQADTRFRAVSIRPGENSCEAARQFGRMRFLCAKAPRLPVPECTAATCTCRYVHFADRRSGQDRRATYDWTRERELGVVNRRSGRGRRATDAVA
jgi:hypothetical protein